MISQTWWYLARASGVTAWVLLALSVVWGLLLSTSVLKSWSTPKWLLDLHRFLGGLALLFTVFHLAGLVADSYVQLGPADLLVPLASPYKTWPVAGGILALYTLVAVELTSLAMARLPRRWWKRIHMTSFATYWLATVHTITAGTDATNPALWWTTTATSAVIVFLTLYRVLADADAQRPARRKRPAAGAGASRVSGATGDASNMMGATARRR